MLQQPSDFGQETFGLLRDIPNGRVRNFEMAHELHNSHAVDPQTPDLFSLLVGDKVSHLRRVLANQDDWSLCGEEVFRSAARQILGTIAAALEHS